MMTIAHIASANFPLEVSPTIRSEAGEINFQIHAFQEQNFWTRIGFAKPVEHAVVTYGEPENNMLVRVHSECFSGDVLHALNCDCGRQLDFALSEIIKAGKGMIIYMRDHEGRGNGLASKLQAVAHENVYGTDTVDAYEILKLPVDSRRYDAAVAIVQDFGLSAITLLTNNPSKIEPFEEAGIVVQRKSCWVGISHYAQQYRDAQIEKMGHIGEPIFVGDADHPLANFYPAAFEIADRKYASVEHYYQAQKFVGTDLYDQVANAPTPARAKELSRENSNLVRADWEQVKEEIMYMAVKAKFIQNPILLGILLDTDNQELIEDSPDDTYWGVTPHNGGANRMGIMLMRVRQEFRTLLAA
jgi:GTP cyclohydrolase II